ncbi:MAG: TlpA family protein disulfide reductase [Rhodothermales bacterium]|nr:TlpA family protein disulfide reductase [Rhodothermales bacterium]MBO6780584.1 TlpA family protein disulfide reductase [Rhodothermales bacterium]
MDLSIILAAAVLMLTVGLVFLWLLLSRKPGFKPQDPTEWAGAVLSSLLILSSIALILVTLQRSGDDPVMFVAEGTEQPEIVDMALSTEAGNFAFRGVDDGDELDLASLEGKVVLLNFWATWCAPCLQEIPELNRLADKYPDDLVVLSLSDEDPATLQGFEEFLELRTFSAFVEAGSPLPAPFSDAFNIRPTSFVIDREGVVRRYLLGQRSFDIFERFVQPYI